MTWTRQVLHVAAKDLRFAKWLFVAYAAATALATLEATRLLSLHAGALNSPELLVPFAFWVTAMIVERDSPARMDALWVTCPLSPSAVAVAKALAVAICVLLPGAIGEVMVFAAHHVSTSDVPALLAGSIGAELSLLVLAMAMACVVRDVRAFVVVAIGYFIASQLVAWSVPPTFGPLIRVVPSTICLALIGYKYLGLGRRDGWKAGALAGVLCLAVPTVNDRGVTISHTTERTNAGSSRSAATPRGDSVVVIDALVNTLGQLEMSVADRKAAAAGVRETIDSLTIRIDEANGHTAVVRPPMLVVHQRVLDPGESVRWLSPPETWGDSSYETIQLPPDQAAALTRQGTTLRITGVLRTSHQRLVAAMPVRAAGIARIPNMMFRIDSARGGAEPTIALQSSFIDRRDNALWMGTGFERYTYVAVNERRHEALTFETGASTGTTMELPLPGLSALVTRRTMRAAIVRGRAPSIEDAWMNEATLDIFEWVPARSDPIELKVNRIRVKPW